MQNDLPLVSIIIPVYNGEKYIGECIQSVINQSYPNKEIIVTDDGSTDHSRQVVESFGDQVIYHYQDNAGSAVARNTGIANARGRYIAFNDGDDLWAPERLMQQVRFLEQHPDYGVATGRFQHVNQHFKLASAVAVDDSKPPKVDETMSGWVYHTLFECSWYHIIAALVRAEVLEHVRFNPDFRRGQDYDFWLQLAHHTRIAQLENNYAYYRKNQESISHRPHPRNYRAEIMEHNLRIHGTSSQDGRNISQERLNQLFHMVWFEYGYELFLAGWYRLALSSFNIARRCSPLRADSYKFIVRCLLNLYKDRSPT
uniref:glycosyltransferase family 2 protein n=1 Tax=Marinobacterium profundum TaxID=1714300 RepID=UPI0008345B5D|nr:glycosyltransferase family 2 protein [Marinobacterium profundum]